MSPSWVTVLAAATGKPPKGGFGAVWIVFFVVAAVAVVFFWMRSRRR